MLIGPIFIFIFLIMSLACLIKRVEHKLGWFCQAVFEHWSKEFKSSYTYIYLAKFEKLILVPNTTLKSRPLQKQKRRKKGVWGAGRYGGFLFFLLGNWVRFKEAFVLLVLLELSFLLLHLLLRLDLCFSTGSYKTCAVFLSTSASNAIVLDAFYSYFFLCFF